MSLVTNSDGNTPLSPEELAGLIPSLATKEELNEWERDNILLAREWATGTRTTLPELVSDNYVRKLHLRMFDQTWKWAGQYRTCEKNLGVPWQQIRERLGVLCDDVLFWSERRTYPPAEIAVRFHHRLVVIHPFPNGNGRHARLMADLLMLSLGYIPLTWGSRDLVSLGELRIKYLDALREADSGKIQPLVEFARS